MARDIHKLIEQIKAIPPEDQQRVRAALDAAPAAASEEAFGKEAPGGELSADERAELRFQERLVSAGLLKEVRPRRRDQRAFDRFQPVRVEGKPLSETIIEERR
jgi:hypothetical protein